MIRYFFAFLSLCLLLPSCSTKNAAAAPAAGGEQVVNLYTHRHYDTDKKIFQKFEKETGIRVNVVTANADELLMKLESEKELTSCDLFVTVDAQRLVKAREKELLQPIRSQVLEHNIVPQYRDPDGYWFAQTMRGRVFVVKKGLKDIYPELSYEDLAKPEWKGKVLMRSSESSYNQALLASMIAHMGPEDAAAWVKKVVGNFAREPKGNDRDQVKDIAAGKGAITLVNTYYLGKMQKSDNAAEKAALEQVEVIFPNQMSRGTHINISGSGVAKYAKHRENAIKLLEFLSRPDIQEEFALANEEYPVNGKLSSQGILAKLGTFRADTLHFDQLAKYNDTAVKLFEQARWR
jgi:iron(III) transport system substrate-binding protein